MKLLERYPTVSMFLTFFISSCFFAYCSLQSKVIIGAIGLILAITIFLVSRISPNTFSKDLSRALVLVMTALTVAATLSAVYINVYAKTIKDNSGKTDNVTLIVEECKYTYSYSSGYIVKVTESDKLLRGTMLLLTTDKGYMPAGTILRGDVSYLSLSKRNSGTFDVEKYYNSKNILLEADDSALQVTGIGKKFSIKRAFKSINDRLTAMIVAHCEHDAGGLAAAVLLGNDEYLADSTARDYRRIGISHLLVVSGTHFAVLISTADSIWKRLKIRRKSRAIINIGLILFLMGITGFTTSVVRAGIMHLLVQFSLLLFKKANAVNSLAISGTLLVLINPLSVFDVGMQLSFTAAYCCIIFQMLKWETLAQLKNKIGTRKIKNKFAKAISTVVETIALTTLINLFTLPIIWLYFGEVSLIAVFANIIFIPLITLLMYLTVIHLVLYPLCVFIPITSYLLNGFVGILNYFAEKIAVGSKVIIPINYSFAVYFLVPICIMLVIFPLLRGKYRLFPLMTAIITACSMLITIQTVEYKDKENIHFSYITSGKNDGFVVKSDGSALICDISDGSYSFGRKLTDEVSALHVSEVDTLLLTHYHNKHVQLITRIAENEILRTLILPEPTHENEFDVYNSILSEADEFGIEVITIPIGGSFYHGDAIITLYSRTYLSRSTHPITAVRIEMRDEDAVILSGSFNESSVDLFSPSEEAEYLIFGAHNPVYKKTFGLDFSSSPKEIIYCSNAYEYMDDPLKEYVDSSGIIDITDAFRVIIKGNTLTRKQQ